MRWFKRKQANKKSKPKVTVVEQKNKVDYFEEAGSFASDMVSDLLDTRNRYQKVIGLMGTCLLLLCVGMVALALTHRSRVLIVHRDDNGVVWTSWAKASEYVSTTRAELRAELTQYVITRESYHYDEFNFQYKMVGLISSNTVFNAFADAQSANADTSNLSVLGEIGTKTVKVKNIVFVDFSSDKTPEQTAGTPHQNLAQIYFTVTTHSMKAQDATVPYIATVSWKYEGVPQDPGYQAYDWNGFVITRYDRVQATTLGYNSNA
jgi:type IV secretory pathway component VirB8